ncbi:MAG: flavodoxin, partial [Firmicutes bacterium]|nr:flavodoxin [Bacillota bacterium]
AVGINGINLIKNNFEALKEKTLIVFATGATPPRDEDLQKVWESNFSEEQRKKIYTFYFRGGFDFSKLSTANKILMSMMKLKLKLKNEKVPSARMEKEIC